MWVIACPILRLGEFGVGPVLFPDPVHLVSVLPYFEILCIWCRSRPFQDFVHLLLSHPISRLAELICASLA